MGSIVAESIIVFTVIKIVGAAYLVYLGIHAIRHRNDHTGTSPTANTRPSSFRLLRKGSIVGATNPNERRWRSHVIGLGGGLALTGNKP